MSKSELRESIDLILKNKVGELNTPKLRKQVVKELESKCKIEKYKVTIVCDERNNSKYVIDNNKLRVSVNLYSDEEGNEQIRREISLNGVREW